MKIVLVAIDNLDTIGYILLKKDEKDKYDYPQEAEVCHIKSNKTNVLYRKDNIEYQLRLAEFPLQSHGTLDLNWFKFKQLNYFTEGQFSDLNWRIFDAVKRLLNLGITPRHFTRCNQCGWIYNAISAVELKEWRDKYPDQEKMTTCKCGNDYRNFRPATCEELKAIQDSTISQILEEIETLEN